jgi:hypothetical protein
MDPFAIPRVSLMLQNLEKSWKSVSWISLCHCLQGNNYGVITRVIRTAIVNRSAQMLDETGYLQMTREEASLSFWLLHRRYEKASIVLTSNTGFTDWGEIFGDIMLATAILDRCYTTQPH